MITKEMIDNALTAHSQWKKRLLEAIESGQSIFKPEIIRNDNSCEFGKWLYSLSEVDRLDLDYRIIKSLHSDFHKVAGEVLSMAMSGSRNEAQNKISNTGEFGEITGKLLNALQMWKNKL
jgi:hypothetical protein